MAFLTRLRLWGSIAVCWGLAVAALYVHPAFWAAFGVVLITLVYLQLRQPPRA